jgi:putative ABC transport system substrate-binding protein
VVPVIGFIGDGSLETRRDYLAAFLRGLAETGYVDGRNVIIEYRWAEDRSDRLPGLIADLARRQVAVLAPTNTASALAAKAATAAIPIVFLHGSDPVQIGLVSSLNRPGGNITGVTVLAGELGAKRLELLREVVPAATLIASRVVQAAAVPLGVRLLTLHASNPYEIESAFESLIQRQASALLVSADQFFDASQRDQIIALAARSRIPTMFGRGEAATAGGLISYGTDFADAYRQVGILTGRILKGEKPADLPVQQVTKVELVINLKTAKTLGITFPTSLLVRADGVIE